MSNLARALLAELDDEALDALADALAPRLERKLASESGSADGWLSTKAAAEYLDMTVDALHRLTGSRSVPFEQEVRGGKCWFLRSELDAWRRGEWQR